MAKAFGIAADVVEAWAVIRKANEPVAVGVHAVVKHSQKVANSGTCGYYHREDLVSAAAFMLEAIARLDEATANEYPHDCDRRTRGNEAESHG